MVTPITLVVLKVAGAAAVVNSGATTITPMFEFRARHVLGERPQETIPFLTTGGRAILSLMVAEAAFERKI